MNVLVTGGGGVLAGAFAQCARNAGWDVDLCAREAARDGDISWDVARSEAPAGLTRLPQCVVHAAAEIGALDAGLPAGGAFMTANVLGSYRVAAWCAQNRIEHLVYISSAIVYGHWEGRPKTEGDGVDPWAAGSYAASKYLGESAVEGVRTKGVTLSILRLSSLYGDAYRDGLPQRFLAQGRRDGRIDVQAPIDDAFHLLHVEDAAKAIVSVIERKVDGLWNIGGPALVSLEDLAGTCAGAMSLKVKAVLNSRRQPRILNWVDDSLARRTLGYQPNIGLDEGIWRISQNIGKWSNSS